MVWIEAYFTELKNLLLDMSLWLLLGFLIAGLLHVFFPEGKIQRLLGRGNTQSVFRAAAMGVPLPLCSCGVIPAGVSLYKNGASQGASVSFLISTPQTGVDSILVTYSMLGLPFAFLRPVIAFITGIVGGMITNHMEKATPSGSLPEYTGKVQSVATEPALVRLFRYAFYEFLSDIAKWLVIGLLVAALIAVVIPDDFFANQFHNSFVDMLIILLVSLPMYICATSSVPIAAVLFAKGLSPGAVLVFLMAGPASNAATIAVIRKVFGNRTFLIYFFTLVISSLAFGAAVNLFIPHEWFESYLVHSHKPHAHGFFPEWLRWASGILLMAMIAHVGIKKSLQNMHKRIDKNSLTPMQSNPMNKLKIQVTGMTCSHCKTNVEMNLKKLPGVEQVLVELGSGEVSIQGKSIDPNQVKTAIEEIGYTYKGQLHT